MGKQIRLSFSLSVFLKEAFLLGGMGIMRKQTGKLITGRYILQPSAEKPAMINVYPNPVLSGTSINIGCEELEEGYYAYQLLSAGGQQVQYKQIWVDAGAGIMNMEIPVVVAGSYFIALTNKETGKRFSEKIVIH